MQTILGAGGAIGTALAKSLPAYTDRIRLVSRNPRRVNETDELFPADLLNAGEVSRAVGESSVVYLTAGFPYRWKVWQQAWPVVMTNVLSACQRSGAKLVFFDNVYMLDPAHLSDMTEETPVKPTSRKGKIRAGIDEALMDAWTRSQVKAMIVRSADFYGPGVKTSVLQEMVLKNLAAGKAANWFCSLDHVHSFTFTPDAGRATALLGNQPDAFNQIWNLPTARPAMTGREWVDAFAKALRVKPRTVVAGKIIVQAMGLFNPIMREFGEMLYQYDRAYSFNSSKFETAFPSFPVTSYPEGIRQVIDVA